MTGLARSLWPDGFAEHWQFVQGPENHDIVYRDREQRVARLGDPGNPRSWYGRSRARVATGDQPDGTRAFRCSSWARNFSKTSSGRTISSSTTTCCCTGPASMPATSRCSITFASRAS